MSYDWWVEYKVIRAFSEGFAILLEGPKLEPSEPCLVRAQTIVTDWLDATPWYVGGSKFPSMEVNRAEVEELHALISRVRISPFPPIVASIDGETHTLTLHAFQNVSFYL